MTLEERAKLIASTANECCERSDGYEEDIYALALRMLQEAVAEAEAATERGIEETSIPF